MATQTIKSMTDANEIIKEVFKELRAEYKIKAKICASYNQEQNYYAENFLSVGAVDVEGFKDNYKIGYPLTSDDGTNYGMIIYTKILEKMDKNALVLEWRDYSDTSPIFLKERI